MAFRIPNHAKTWFKHIQGKKETGFELDFDIYYFCLMAGFFKVKKANLSNTQTTEIIKSFPKEYKTHRHLIVALFIKKELDYLGVTLKERDTLNKELSKLIDPNSPSSLSDNGMGELNKFAYGGFHQLEEHFAEPPHYLETFLRSFYEWIN